MKKIAALILAVVLIFSIASVSASAEMQSFPTYKEAIYYAIYNMEDEVNLREYNVTEDEVYEYIYYLVNQQPEINYLQGIRGGHYVGSGPQIADLTFEYEISKNEMLSQRKFIDDTLNPVLAKVDANWSDTEKALYVHDWLVSNFMYDYRLFETPGTENHDIYGFLKDGIGVCQSYAYTYMYMMRKLGLESYMAINDTDVDNDGEADISGHGWNVVKIDGNWYHVDATYDDPILGESFHYDYVGEVSHDKFLLSDEQIAANDINKEYFGFFVPFVDEQIVCNEYMGDDLWRSAVSSVVPVGEYWYYLDPVGENGGLLRTKDFKTTERVTEVGKFSVVDDIYYWEKDGGGGYRGYYTGLFEYNEHLFFSDSRNIYVYDTHHNEVKPLPIEREEGNYYFGLNMKGKTITYITSRTNISENVIQGSYTLSGHFLVTDWEVLRYPTETEDGLRVKRCYFCGETVESQTIPSLSQGVIGDTDGNGKVDTSDLAKMKLYLAGANKEISVLADVDSSDKVDTSDLAKMKLFLAGAINEF